MDRFDVLHLNAAFEQLLNMMSFILFLMVT